MASKNICNNSDFNHEKRLKLFAWLATILSLIVIAIYIGFFNYHKIPISKDASTWGQLGDFFGGILNPIFGFTSLIALLYSINFQVKELKLSRVEVAKTSEALVEQHKTMKIQNFETTFFSLIKSFHDSKEYIRFGQKNSDPKFPYFGNNAFTAHFRKTYFINDVAYKKMPILDAIKIFEDEFITEKNSGSNLKPYFQHLYFILEYLQKSKIENQDFYAKIIYCQLSQEELFFILLYFISEQSSHEFKSIIIRYQFLENLPELIPNTDEFENYMQQHLKESIRKFPNVYNL
ncbi:MAG: putative phage abortive infection protein [Pseudomonadota bacterium]